MYGMFIVAFATLENEEERKKLQDFYEENEDKIFYFAMSYTKNQDIAEEAIQKAFIYIIENKEKYLKLSHKKLLNSTIVIVKSRCLDIFRSRKINLKKFYEEDIEDLKIINTAYERSVDEEVILSLEYELIRKHMKSLDEISRLVLEMKYIEDKSYKQIGTELDMTEKHVETKIMRAKEKIRNLIGKELNNNE